MQKKNILIITGRKAANTIKESSKMLADVLVLDLEIAAFTTPLLLKRSLPPKKYDLIVISGLAASDFSILEKEINTPIRLGPKHAIDIGPVLSLSDSFEFSSRVPACEMLVYEKKSAAFRRLKELERNATSPLTLRGIKIGGNSRMKVMAEIVDAGKMSKAELVNRIIYFKECGAEIIDLGISLDTSFSEVADAVKTARSITDLPISIDTLDPDLINAALEAGVDMVLSLNSKNIEKVRDNIIKKSAASVIIPDDVNDLESLFRNIEIAVSSGITDIIADPVLESPSHGLLDSIIRYYEFRKRNMYIPLFFGIGNVTELIDADSIGVNSILSSIAMELNAGILFTPEFSHKNHNSVSELKTASIMMMLAWDRKSAPKDLGIDMLEIKEKRRREFGKLPDSFIEAKGRDNWHLDPSGCFKIELTDNEIRGGKLSYGRIVVRNDRDIIAGNTARDVLDTIIERGLVSRLDHAAYLGRELMKAEIALRTGRSYSQDDKF